MTNFYFEIGEPDGDFLDDEGTVLEKGLRKMGVCKEERKLPIVQMGLFMDDQGIPIAIETFPGNTLDHLTLRPALRKTVDGLDFSRFIMIADRGICNYQNLLHVLDAGNGNPRTIEEKVAVYWSGGLSGSRIQAALNKWNVDLLPGDLYRFMDVDDPDLKQILEAFPSVLTGIGLCFGYF